ncbi:MAG: hypothetical protein CL676_07315 [Bdellovibrionaceae bacterium]|nr:hypothetical protein [Pseudobdellovibrionaceae bacterium]|tara:strand:- start:78 stop:2237 length:2160 start_codon:yes stop_codon:yes gene_type:complete
MKKWIFLAIGATTFLIVALGIWTLSLNSELDQRLSKEWFAPPVEFFYPSIQWRQGHSIGFSQALEELNAHSYRQRYPQEPLAAKDYVLLPTEQCQDELIDIARIQMESCLRFRSSARILFTVVWSDSGESFFFQGSGLQPISTISLDPLLIGEFQSGRPLKSLKVSLPEVPLKCLQAVTAIEDDEFLKHRGVSPSGIARAIVRNILAGRFAQGGSTITQQLVKNYFLTHRKTLKRKLTEQILSVLLETKLNKDQILEKYLNVIYMGQDGPYQVIGMGSASNYYFGKSISDLDLSDCALLAALINNPGKYNPFRNPENATRRRELVLAKMTELQWISEDEKKSAEEMPLPAVREQNTEPAAPYFLELAYKELVELQLPEERGFKVFTSLSPTEQVAMEKGVQEQLPNVRARKKSAENVEVAALRIHLPSYHITSMMGGSNFKTAPYNRVLNAQRQIGSTVKPFIYWQAFQTLNPWDKIVDEKFTWKFDGKDWAPQNYERNFRGEVFLFEALTQSLNVPAVKLAQQIGLEKIRDTLFAAGLTREVSLLPSLALGAVEITPIEMAQMYSTLGNMGQYKKLSALIRVEDFDGKVLYENSPGGSEPRLEPATTATLISTLKLSPEIGTAQSLKYFITPENIAGKTGTTNDLKDAWFVGMSGDHLMVVWVGRDDNLPTGLTGASGALPIWGAIQKNIQSQGFSDFHWPPQTEKVEHEGHVFVVSE